MTSDAFSSGGEAPSRHIADFVSAELGIPREEVSPESSLTDDLGLDRWDLFELLERLEAVYAVKVPDAVVDRIGSVSELADALASSSGPGR